MGDPMQEAVRRVLAGEGIRPVARDLGLPWSSVRYNVLKVKPRIVTSIPPVGPSVQTIVQPVQGQVQIKTFDPLAWLVDARIIQGWLVKEVARRLQKEGVDLKVLLVALGILSDKIHQAEVLLPPPPGVGPQAVAEARVIIMVQEGGRVMPLEEFVGRPPSLAAGSAESLSRETETRVP